jgi:hypothetical protein
VNTEGTVFVHDPRWGDYPFVLPTHLSGVSLVGVPLVLKLSGYNSSYGTEMQGTFTVSATSTRAAGAGTAGRALPSMRLVDPRAVAVSGIANGEQATIEIHALNGALVYRQHLSGSGIVWLPESGSGGALVAVLTIGRSRHVTQLVAH